MRNSGSYRDRSRPDVGAVWCYVENFRDILSSSHDLAETQSLRTWRTLIGECGSRESSTRLNRELSLRVLAQIMAWDDDRAGSEYRWLKLMGSIKYDSYSDFQAGMRFIESLVTWLQQFPLAERETAYSFVRTRLVFIGLSETHHLVAQFYPRFVHERIVDTVASRHQVPNYLAIADPAKRDEMDQLRRKTLFLGLSDGARIDVLRHNNVGRLSNEQIVPTAQLDPDKWQTLVEDLREELGDPLARFEVVYLIDDFTATGTSFLRAGKLPGEWKGKLKKFSDSIAPVKSDIFSPNWSLCVHHYIASHAATLKLEANLAASRTYFGSIDIPEPVLTFGAVLPEDLPLSTARGDADFMELAEKYYDSSIETVHTRVGGVPRITLGYGGCGLPVVLEHNTPNNSVALLWAETSGDGPAPSNHPMRPLFRRRQRHVGRS